MTSSSSLNYRYFGVILKQDFRYPEAKIEACRFLNSANLAPSVSKDSRHDFFEMTNLNLASLKVYIEYFPLIQTSKFESGSASYNA
jgi:hypothetical protein